MKRIQYKTHCNRAYGATSARFRWQRITAGHRADGFFTIKSSAGFASACDAAVRMPNRSLQMRLVQMVHARSSTAAYLQGEIHRCPINKPSLANIIRDFKKRRFLFLFLHFNTFYHHLFSILFSIST